jgi:hypothetical protein
MAKKTKKRTYSKGAAKKVGRAMKEEGGPRNEKSVNPTRSGAEDPAGRSEQKAGARDRSVRGREEGRQGTQETCEEKVVTA